MSCPAVPRAVGASDDFVTVTSVVTDQPVAADQPVDSTASERQSVSELVKNYNDPSEGQKRDRSESGDAAPAGKRGARDRGGAPSRSPSSRSDKSFKECLDTAIDDLESRITVSISRDLHEFREALSAEIEKLHSRVRDLEKHIEERDVVIDDLTSELHQSRKEIVALQTRAEEAEVNSRLPCLVLSGPAMASRRAPRLEPPLPGQTAPAAGGGSRPGPASLGQGRAAVTSQPADRPAAAAEGRSEGGQCSPGAGRGGGGGGARGRSGAWAGDSEEREDINALVVNTLNKCMPGLGLSDSDIDRAHRLPGPNHRVIVRFVRSGQDSARE